MTSVTAIPMFAQVVHKVLPEMSTDARVLTAVHLQRLAAVATAAFSSDLQEALCTRCGPCVLEVGG